MKATTAASIITAIIASYLLAACNTTEGFGTDVKKAGQAIHDTAKHEKNEM